LLSPNQFLAANYFKRRSGNNAASSAMGTGGPFVACFSLIRAGPAGVAHPQLTGAEHESQPQLQWAMQLRNLKWQ
jgi:hypothetical protein